MIGVVLGWLPLLQMLALASAPSGTLGRVEVDPDHSCVLKGRAVVAGKAAPETPVPLGLFRDAAEGHRPFPEPWVAVESTRHQGAVAQVLTGPDGAFRFEGLQRGVYVVRILLNLPNAPSPPVVLNAGSCEAQIEILVALGAEIRGRVLDAEGQPATAVHVFVAAVEDASGGNGAAGRPPTPIIRTDGDGGFLLEHVPVGTVHLQAAGRGYGYSSRHRLVVEDGAKVADLVLQLRDERDRLGEQADRTERIGVALDFQAVGPVIDEVVEGMPAAKAGLLAGDRVVTVDGHETALMSAVEFLSRCRGPVGSSLVLGIERGEGAPIEAVLVRTPFDGATP